MKGFKARSDIEYQLLSTQLIEAEIYNVNNEQNILMEAMRLTKKTKKKTMERQTVNICIKS